MNIQFQTPYTIYLKNKQLLQNDLERKEKIEAGLFLVTLEC